MVFSKVSAQVPTLIPFNDQRIFASGSNIAWINFAGDIGPGNTDLEKFETMFKELNDNGGNAMRFWLHTSGAKTPAWNGSDVTGPGVGTIEDLKAILDIAEKYDIGLLLTLWSFDMLRNSNGTTNVNRSKAILTDSVKMQTYINNALIPMVTALKDHKAVLAWEVFNEPEGMSNQFGWDGITKVDMLDIQRFVNRVTGAIHRIDKTIKVTTGAWSFKSLSDRFGNHATDKNYYRNDRLIQAGGDSLGVLDYYTVHYYTWAGTSLSPFHNDVDYWGLDKPVMVAEFYAKEPIFTVPINKLFETLYTRGYAGALAWQWVDSAQQREGNEASWPNSLINTNLMEKNYPEAVVVALNGSRIELTSDKVQLADGDDVTISWKVRGSVSRTLNGVSIPKDSSKAVQLSEKTTFTLKATAPDGTIDSASIVIDVVNQRDLNRSINQKAESSLGLVTELTDGSLETEWSASVGNEDWLQIELEKAIDVYRVVLDWGEKSTDKYILLTSLDGTQWEAVSFTSKLNGSSDTLLLSTEKSARFIRLNFNPDEKVDINVKEFETFGSISDNQPPVLEITKPVQNEEIEGLLDYYLQFTVKDGTTQISRFVLLANGDSVAGKNSSPFQFVYKPAEGEVDFQIKAILENSDFIYSKPVNVTFIQAPERRRFEAESAILTGETTVLSTVSGSSGNKFVFIENSGKISWPFIFIRTAGTYKVKFGYYLPFDYKAQYLNVNEQRVGEVAFELPLTTWLETEEMEVQLVEGNNNIEIEKSWGYMYLDYVDIIGNGQTTVSNEDINTEKVSFELRPNFPNPFNPSTTIEFSLDKTSLVQLTVYDIAGRKVANLINAQLGQGVHSSVFDASSLASGLYIVRLQANDRVKISKMTLIK